MCNCELRDRKWNPLTQRCENCGKYTVADPDLVRPQNLPDKKPARCPCAINCAHPLEAHKFEIMRSQRGRVRCTLCPEPSVFTEINLDFTGNSEPVTKEHAYSLVNEMQPFKTLMFDAGEVRTLKALVTHHKLLVDTISELINARNLTLITHSVSQIEELEAEIVEKLQKLANL